jgi:hypothetical protein
MEKNYILAIDPGNVESAYVLWDSLNEVIVEKGKLQNEALRAVILTLKQNVEHCWVEMIQAYGMPVGIEVFDTCVWIGRFMEVFGAQNVTRVPRKMVVHYHTGATRAKDGNVRQSLIDRYGCPGTKKHQGKLYGVSKDVWQALALAVFAADKKAGKVYTGEIK